ncbi:hypothetical protein K469DRAFT_376711 [Zopfia rhizophila CBS 207.26]|uniref:Uncharacterized protein n=1 Tax=Zopfia rhizophila CBS 207.26 TaxID=1314779 RepID=A0A6A6DD57_9PEZI|nr:hypothetical protein K469DRAFT_376711 [Zopfia rhizophila CBS 207.26]
MISRVLLFHAVQFSICCLCTQSVPSSLFCFLLQMLYAICLNQTLIFLSWKLKEKLAQLLHAKYHHFLGKPMGISRHDGRGRR